MIDRRPHFLLALTFLAPGCTKRPPAVPNAVPSRVIIEGGTAELPGHWVGDTFMADVLIDGEGPLPFLIDTGASSMVLDVRTAHDLGLQIFEERGIDFIAASGHRVPSRGWAHFGEVRVGDVRFEDVSIGIQNLEGLESALGEPLAGLLGRPVFLDGVLTLDYPGRVVSLSEGRLPAANGTDILAIEHRTDDNRWPDDVRAYLSLEVSSHEYAMLIDTAFDAGLVLPDAFHSYWERLPAPIELIVGATGIAEPHRVGRLRSDVALGRYTLRRPTAAISDGDAVLGKQVLRRFVVSIDEHAIRLTGNHETELTFDPIRAPGFAYGISDGKYLVADVANRSPAHDQGLRKQDEILEINGRPAAELDTRREFLAELFDADEVVLRIRSNGESRTLRIPIGVLVP